MCVQPDIQKSYIGCVCGAAFEYLGAAYAVWVLWLDGKTIRQGTSRQNFTRSLDQTRAYAQPRMIWGVLYYAFALQPLKTCSNKKLLKLVRQKKAILYPWAPQLAHDYPELFERKAET